MMGEIWIVNAAGLPVTLYALVAAAAALLCGGWMLRLAPRHELRPRAAALYFFLAALLALALGRGIYCAVRWEWLFLDEMGNFAGFAPFFDTANGGASVVGVLAGCLLAAPLTAALTKKKAAQYLDCAALPGLLLFALLRLAEPLAGQGYGDLLLSPALCFFPLALLNDMGDYSLSVCFIEGVLALLLFLALLTARKKVHKSGSLALYALTLLCACQIMPESLRRDDVLFVFIFARVTQIGYAVLLCGAMALALLRGARRGLGKKQMLGESGLMLLGVALCIGAEFALDKTNLSDILVYAVMIAALLAMACLVCRRIHKEDTLP